jgi:cytoskeleton protein RodZ
MQAMNPSQAMSPDDQNVVEFSESPGRRLRVHRQSRGLEIERVAAQLHLRVPVVESLEQDRYQELPGPVFVAGYLRNYARLLGMDPEPLLAAYRAINPEVETAAPRFTPPPRQEIGSGHLLMRLVTLSIAAAVIALLVLWWQNRADVIPRSDDGTEAWGLAPEGDAVEGPTTNEGLTARGVVVPPLFPDPSPTSALPLPPVADAGPAADGPPSAAPDATGAAPSSGPQVGADGTAAQGPSAISDATRAPGEAAATATAREEVALQFSGPAWIDVRDASGASVLSGEMRKGDRRVLSGTPPYSFVIGNAGATAITVNGQPLDLTNRAKGNVARFQLDPGRSE